MSTATQERPAKTTSTDHSPEVKAILKKGRMSEGTELNASQVKALTDLPDSATVAMIEAIVHGKPSTTSSGKGGGAKRGPSKKYPEAIVKVFERARELTGAPDKGGPKVPLNARQVEAIKKALASKGKANAEVKALLDAVPDAQLLKIAKGQKASKDAQLAVRSFLRSHDALKDDRTMYGRKGAAIVLAFREGA